jgi:hypothetical protein
VALLLRTSYIVPQWLYTRVASGDDNVYQRLPSMRDHGELSTP